MPRGTRGTYRPTETRTVPPHGELGALTRSGDRIALDHRPDSVDRAAPGGTAASTLARVVP